MEKCGDTGEKLYLFYMAGFGLLQQSIRQRPEGRTRVHTKRATRRLYDGGSLRGGVRHGRVLQACAFNTWVLLGRRACVQWIATLGNGQQNIGNQLLRRQLNQQFNLGAPSTYIQINSRLHVAPKNGHNEEGDRHNIQVHLFQASSLGFLPCCWCWSQLET